jgi:hypothetical protein
MVKLASLLHRTLYTINALASRTDVQQDFPAIFREQVNLLFTMCDRCRCTLSITNIKITPHARSMSLLSRWRRRFRLSRYIASIHRVYAIAEAMSHRSGLRGAEYIIYNLSSSLGIGHYSSNCQPVLMRVSVLSVRDSRLIAERSSYRELSNEPAARRR